MLSLLSENSETTTTECATFAETCHHESQSSFFRDVLLSAQHILHSVEESSPIQKLAFLINNHWIATVFGPDIAGPSPTQITHSLLTIFVTLLLYHVLFGNRHWRRRRHLTQELHHAKQQLTFLEDRLQKEHPQKEIRVFMEGAFDMFHFGHQNAFRLGRSLGTHLIVGVNSDESITKCKAAPLMNNEERLAMVQSCKFVDEVVPNTPYVMSKEYIDWIFETYHVDYIVHGDDPCIVDGKDVYETAKQAGKFRTIPRTEGVSTTDIVGRMLLLTKEHHMKKEDSSMLGSQSKFLTTTRLLQLFSADVTAPAPGMRVVYIDGAWDVFHPGHVALLKAAKERGDYLIVGIHGDSIVNQKRGMNLPLLNLHERVLSVLGCKFVDDVLIDAPYVITLEMIASLKLSQVLYGTCFEDSHYCSENDERYKYAKESGIFGTVKSLSEFRLENIFKRIRKNQDTFQARFERKKEAETQHYTQKYGNDFTSQ
jgi:ethanolamine-phosphate cytidylyltransferase